jgi:hypothetical protein
MHHGESKCEFLFTLYCVIWSGELGRMSKKAVVAKLDVLYTKLPKGTEEDLKRPEGIIDIRTGIRTLYNPTASKKRSYLSQHILSVSQFYPVPTHKARIFTSNLATASSFHILPRSLFTAYSIVQCKSLSYKASLNMS